jgi:hypothetical protein
VEYDEHLHGVAQYLLTRPYPEQRAYVDALAVSVDVAAKLRSLLGWDESS